MPLASIRPLEREDLQDVAALVRANLRGWSRSADVLALNLIDHPWAPAPLRSLVAVDDGGAIIGTVGAQSRRVLFGDRECEAVCVSHLAVAADRRAGAAGAMLVRELLSGDQDLTWTDSGTPGVVRIWRLLGGDLDHTRACDWMLVLNRRRWAKAVSAAIIDPRRWLGPAVAPIRAFPFSSRGTEAPAGSEASTVHAEEVSTSRLAAELPAMSRRIELRVAHDEAYLDYAFSYLAALGVGEQIVRRIILRNGRPIGWFAYLARPTVARVLHLGAPASDAAVVTAALIDDARARGIAVLSGRLEPHLDEPMRQMGALLGLSQQPLVHSRDPALLAAVGSSASLLTEMDLIDSEWW